MSLTSRRSGCSGGDVGNFRRKLGNDLICPRYVRPVGDIGYCLVG